MNVSYKMVSPQGEEYIARLEDSLVVQLPDNIRSFLLQWGGAELGDNFFDLEDNRSNVRSIFTVDEILECKPYLDDVDKLVFPISEDDCGNHVVIDLNKGGAFFFWDHEYWNDDMEKLAENPEEFLSMLRSDRNDLD